jgi:hypothetical protein
MKIENKIKKEERTMKTKWGVLFIVFLAGIMLGTVQPSLVFSSAQDEFLLWDPFIDISSFSGTKLAGTLTIVYNPNFLAGLCDNGQNVATMFYAVRFPLSKTIYTFEGAKEGICLGDIGTPGSGGQGDAVMLFLGNAVKKIFPNSSIWKLRAVSTPGISLDSLSFIADILIMVK